MQKIIDRQKGGFKLQPWDWAYYAEKLRKEKYDLNEDEVKQYFKMENVRQGVFDCQEDEDPQAAADGGVPQIEAQPQEGEKEAPADSAPDSAA